MKEKGKEITCKTTGWFIWRAVLMSMMFLGFGAYFYYDGAIGYKKKNADYYNYAAKSEVRWAIETAATQLSLIKEGRGDTIEEKSPALNRETWKKFIETHKVRLFEKKDDNSSTLITDVEGCLPDGYEFPKKIPNVFLEKYEDLISKEGEIEEIWSAYAAENGLNEGASDYFKNADVIKAQFKWAIGSGIFGGIAFIFLLRTFGRSMKVNTEGYTAPGGAFVPYDSIFKIDKRKWKRKGLAYLYYKNEEGEEKKAKVDGMIYGQFDMKNPNNAEFLYQQIEDCVGNVEVIDYEEEDEEEIEGVEEIEAEEAVDEELAEQERKAEEEKKEEPTE